MGAVIVRMGITVWAWETLCGCDTTVSGGNLVTGCGNIGDVWSLKMEMPV